MIYDIMLDQPYSGAWISTNFELCSFLLHIWNCVIILGMTRDFTLNEIRITIN